MNITRFTTLALAAALVCSTAMAAGTTGNTTVPPQGGDRPHREGMFERADLNHDGIVTKDEFLKESAQFFDKVDTNHDGKLTQDEIKAFKEQKREEWKANHPGMEKGHFGGGRPAMGNSAQ